MNIAEYLKVNKTLTYSNVGTSMLPLIRQGKDTFTITEKNAYLEEHHQKRFKAGDVVLYNGTVKKYILHRIIEVRPDSYVILGDHCVAKEHGVKDEDIIGIMTAYSRSGKNHSVTEPGYLRYSRRMMRLHPLRIFVQKTGGKAKRAVRKVIKPHGK